MKKMKKDSTLCSRCKDKMKHHSKKDDKIGIVMEEFKEGALHSGSKKGPRVTNPKQAIAIAISESKKKKRK